MSVRDAAPDDADAIAHVHVRTWQDSYGHVFPADALAALSVERRVEGWRRLIAELEPRSHVLVAEDEGACCGFASGGPAEEDAALGELYAIYVLPGAWGRGHGRALLAESARRLREAAFGEAILWVLEDNPRTRRFYEQAGWRPDDGRREQTFLGTPAPVVRYRRAL